MAPVIYTPEHSSFGLGKCVNVVRGFAIAGSSVLAIDAYLGALQITRLVRLRINGGHPFRDSTKLLSESDHEDLTILLLRGFEALLCCIITASALMLSSTHGPADPAARESQQVEFVYTMTFTCGYAIQYSRGFYRKPFGPRFLAVLGSISVGAFCGEVYFRPVNRMIKSHLIQE